MTRTDLTAISADMGPVVVRKTTLKIQESQKTAQVSHWNVQKARDHQVKDVKGSRKTTLKAQTLTAVMTALNVVVDVAADLDKDAAADKANR